MTEICILIAVMETIIFSRFFGFLLIQFRFPVLLNQKARRLIDSRQMGWCMKSERDWEEPQGVQIHNSQGDWQGDTHI